VCENDLIHCHTEAVQPWITNGRKDKPKYRGARGGDYDGDNRKLESE
jgi:hypothetical protein